jgi:DNA-directed RNA polymerase subunit RPC12/RpoP
MDCSICGNPIEVTSWGLAEGNSAEPINEGRCCDDCNIRVVIPARMKEIKKNGGV